MDIKINKNESEITLEVSSKVQDLKDLEKRITNEMMKKANIIGKERMNGFRPTYDVVRNKFKDEIDREIVTEFFDSVYNDHIRNNYNLLEDPKISKAFINDVINLEISLKTVPEFTLPNYKNLNIKLKESQVDQYELDESLKYIINKNSKVISSDDAIAEEGDIVTINYKGFVDGVAFDGGSQEDYDLRIGSNVFINGFEEQVKGHKSNESFDINVKFPGNYFEESLSGKDVRFEVLIKDIKKVITPEIDDELAKMEGFENLDLLKKDLEDKILLSKKRDEIEILFNDIISDVKSRTSIQIPKSLIDKEVEHKKGVMDKDIERKGITLKEYLDKEDLNEETYLQRIVEESVEELEDMMIIREIIRKENITADEAEIMSYVEEIFKKRPKNLNRDEYINIIDQIESHIKLTKLKNLLVQNN